MGGVKNMRMDIEELIWGEHEKLPADNKNFAIAANNATEVVEELYGALGKGIIDEIVDDYYDW